MKRLMSLILITMVAPAFAGKTLDAIKKRGHLVCGVTTGLPGFAMNKKGKWEGLDVDVCRAVASAVFGDGNKAKFVPLSAQQRFTAIQSGEVDVLTRNTTWTLGRDSSLGLNFAPTNYYDGQGFMVKTNPKIKNIFSFKGGKPTVCVQQGTTTEQNLADFFRANKMTFKPVVMESLDELFKAFISGRCDIYTTDASGLAAERTKVKDPSSLTILPDIISKEPLAPAVRHGDDEWFDIVKWSVYALVAAEEFGISQGNVDSILKSSKDPKVKRFLGKTAGNGKALGLSDDWAYKIIKNVGNYGESFERHVGEKTPLGLPRGLNALWTKGGLQYSPPFR